MARQKLIAKDYFNLANQYYAVYNLISQELQSTDSTLTDDKKTELYEHSKPIFKLAYEFQKKGFLAMPQDMQSSVEDLQVAVEAAAQTISNIFKVGKVIEIVSGLIAIGVVLAVPSPKITSLTVIPALVKELYDDVMDLSQG